MAGLQLIAAALTAKRLKMVLEEDILSAALYMMHKGKLLLESGTFMLHQEQLPAFASNDSTRNNSGAGYRF